MTSCEHKGSFHRPLDLLSKSLAKLTANKSNLWITALRGWIPVVTNGFPAQRASVWQHRSGSTLAQQMACCLMASSHYLDQYWFEMCSQCNAKTCSCHDVIMQIVELILWVIRYVIYDGHRVWTKWKLHCHFQVQHRKQLDYNKNIMSL